MNKMSYNFQIIFDKLKELEQAKDPTIISKESSESQEINELRKIVLEISQDDCEHCYSTT